MWWLVPISAIPVALVLAFMLAPKGWRTVLANYLSVAGAAAVPALIAALDVITSNQFDLGKFFPPWSVPVILAELGMVNRWLRSITDTPIGVKD